MTPEIDWPLIVGALEEPLLVIDREYVVRQVNEAFCRRYGVSQEEAIGRTCHELTHRYAAPCWQKGVDCPLREALSQNQRQRVVHQHSLKDGSTVWEEIIATPIMNGHAEPEYIIEELRDITDLLATQEVAGGLKEQLNVLEGLLPICANCKMIRKADGTWDTVEAYVTEHSEAQFSHGICPECRAALYPGVGGRSRPD